MSAGDPYSDPVTGVLYNKLGLGTAAELDAAEREITHAARRVAFVGKLAHYLGEVNALHPFREGNGRAQRAFFGQLARDAGFTLTWQHLDPARNVEASAAIMSGDPEPMREMLDSLVRGAA
jgi:cell filamentation protein